MKKLLLLIGLVVLYWFSQEETPSIRKQKEIDALSRQEEETSPPMESPVPHQPTVSLEPVNITEEDWTQQVQDIRLQFASGSYVQALATADQKLQEAIHPNTRKWIQTQLPALLDHAAWTHLRLGRCQEAERVFARGVQLKVSPDNRYGYAHCARKLGKIQQAYEALQQNIEDFPDHRVSWLLKAEIHETLYDYDFAIDSLERALELKEDPGVERKILAMKQRNYANDKQIKEEGLHYQVAWPYNISIDGPTIHRWIQESIQDLLKRGYRPPKTPLEIVFYERQGFDELVPGTPGWVDGLFDGRLRIPIQVNPNAERVQSVLRHEISHALLHYMSDGRRFPPWWDEGIAQRASCSNFGCDSYQYPRDRSFPSREELESSFTAYDAVKARHVYSVSLFLILWLERQNPKTLQDMIERVQYNSQLDSDSLLQPYSLDFNELLQKAKMDWDRREKIP